MTSIQVLQWSSLIEPTFQVAPTPGKVSKEEMLMWERMRCVAWGITHYELHKESGRLVDMLSIICNYRASHLVMDKVLLTWI